MVAADRVINKGEDWATASNNAGLNFGVAFDTDWGYNKDKNPKISGSGTNNPNSSNSSSGSSGPSPGSNSGGGNSGKDKEFYGVKIRIIPDFFGGGSYFAGGINVSQSIWDGYQKNGINSYQGRFLMHEYGHFLQNQEGGSFWYNLYAAPSSFVNAIFSNQDEHSRHWAEVQASTMAYYYFGFPKGFIEDKNPINHEFIGLELRKTLYNQHLNNKKNGKKN